jgi:hypothetical protein
MTAQVELSNIFDKTSSSITTLASSSEALMSKAIAIISDPVDLNEARDYIDAWKAQFVVYPRNSPFPERFPNWNTVNSYAIPPTQTLGTIEYTIDATFPTINFPSSEDFSISDLAPFTKTAPTIDTSVTLPDAPTTDVGFSPTYLALTTPQAPELAVTPPTFTDIATDITFDPNTYSEAFAQFSESILSGSNSFPGLNELTADLSAWSDQALSTLLPPWLATIDARLQNKTQPVLAYHQTLLDRFTTRMATETQRAASAVESRSGWELPAAVQQALQATMQQFSNALSQQAQSQVDNKTTELSLEFFEACGDVLAGLNNAVQKLKAQEIEQVLEAHKMALAYAKQSIAALLAQYTAENFTKQDAEYKKAEAGLKVFEAELRVAVLRFDLAQAQLEVEQAKQDNDAAVIQVYRNKAEQAKQQVDIFAAQVSAARSELDLKRLPVEIFELQTRAFSAEIDAHEASISARIAEIENDSVKVKKELAKVQVYEAQSRGYSTMVGAKQALISAQAERNKSLNTEYELKVAADFMPIKHDMLKTQYDYEKYKLTSSTEIAKAEVDLRAAKAEFDFTNRKQEAVLNAYQLMQERNLELMDTELSRLKAITDTQINGSKMVASMAQGAMSAVTGIANVIADEAA